MLHLTFFEQRMIAEIAHHEMCGANGGVPETIDDTGTFFWIRDYVHDDLTEQQAKGVSGSLTSKGMAIVQEHDERDHEILFTDEGFAAYQSFGMEKLKELLKDSVPPINCKWMFKEDAS